MMGPTHAMSGAAGGLAFAMGMQYAGIVDITAVEALVFAGITAGAALLPDLDQPTATLANTWGPVSKVISKATNKTSAGFMNMTAGRNDKHVNNGHRGLTHTLIFLIAATVASLFLLTTGGYWAGIALFYILTSLALQGLWKKKAKQMGAIVSNIIAIFLTFAVSSMLPDTFNPVFLSAAVGVGIFIHILGDAPTVSGVPFFAPFVGTVSGKRWADWHILPPGLRFKANGPINTASFYICAVAFVLLTMATVSGSIFGALV